MIGPWRRTQPEAFSSTAKKPSTCLFLPKDFLPNMKHTAAAVKSILIVEHASRGIVNYQQESV